MVPKGQACRRPRISTSRPTIRLPSRKTSAGAMAWPIKARPPSTIHPIDVPLPKISRPVPRVAATGLSPVRARHSFGEPRWDFSKN